MELLIILVRVDAHDAHDAHMTAYLEHKIREHCTLEHHVVLLPEAIPDESALRAAVLEMVEIPLAPALPQVVSLRVQLRTERRRASCAPLAALCQEHTARARACVRKQLPHIAGRRKILKT